MNRQFLIVLGFVTSFLAFLGCGVLYLNNVIVALRWSPSSMIQSRGGLHPFLDHFCADISTMATLIPLLGFGCIAVGFVRIWRSHDDLATTWFPFFPHYTQINVVAGLVGTIVGLILLGRLKTEDLSLELLTSAMSTALYSSLVAFVWTYFVCTWLRPVMGAFYNHTSDVDENEAIGDSLEAFQATMQNFTENATHASTATKSLDTSVARLAKRVDHAGTAVARFVERQSNDALTNLTLATRQLTQTAAQLSKESAGRLDELKTLRTEIANERAARTELEKTLAQSIGTIEHLKSQNAAAVQAVRGLEQTLRPSEGAAP